MGRLKDFYHDEIVEESLDCEPSEKKETLIKGSRSVDFEELNDLVGFEFLSDLEDQFVKD